MFLRCPRPGGPSTSDLMAAPLEVGAPNGRAKTWPSFLLCSPAVYREPMTDPSDPLTPADPGDLAAALAFALRFPGRKRVHSADDLISAIVARRLVEHLERSGFVVMKKTPIGGMAIGRGCEGQ
jgi:hypothetical protein